MNPLRFTRRNLLRGSLAATATLPLLDAHRVEGQTASPTRFVVFTWPNGTRNNLFWPTGTETDFQLNELTKPLEAYKSKLTFLKGIQLNSALRVGNLGGNLGSEHARGTGGMLTGRPLNAGQEFESFGMTHSGWGSGQSIDQYLAQRLNPMTPFKTFHIGAQVKDTQVRARISYTASNQPVPPREDPKEVFSTLFADPTTDRLLAQRKSVLDANNAEVQRLQQIVGAADRQKLEAHLQAMREVELRLTAAPGTMSTCAKPTLNDAVYTDQQRYSDVGQMQMDLAAAALACDMTRIMTFQWSYSESEHEFPFLSISGNHHVISHDFTENSADWLKYNKIQTWYAERFAYFLAKLDSYKEGDKTLLDNTLILWATEIGEAKAHDLSMMPYVLAGGAGGKIRPGRLLDYTKTPQDNNKMLVSIAHAMGADDLTSFGDASGATGPLSGLT
jgi:hypothetical protein